MQEDIHASNVGWEAAFPRQDLEWRGLTPSLAADSKQAPAATKPRRWANGKSQGLARVADLFPPVRRVRHELCEELERSTLARIRLLSPPRSTWTCYKGSRTAPGRSGGMSGTETSSRAWNPALETEGLWLCKRQTERPGSTASGPAGSQARFKSVAMGCLRPDRSSWLRRIPLDVCWLRRRARGTCLYCGSVREADRCADWDGRDSHRGSRCGSTSERDLSGRRRTSMFRPERMTRDHAGRGRCRR